MKILMVCLGNICRSPLAEGIARHLCQEHKLDAWTIDSAGTSGWHDGDMPDRRSIAVAADFGIDIRRQRSRSLKASDYTEFDLILAMDQQNLADIRDRAPEGSTAKMKLILDYLQPGQDREVPDPYYGGPEGFLRVYEMLDEACRSMLEVESDSGHDTPD